MSQIQEQLSVSVASFIVLFKMLSFISSGRKKQETCWPVDGLEKMINLELLYRAVAAFLVGWFVPFKKVLRSC